MQKINSLWYPRLVTVGKPVETQELAERLARESTVSPADVHAVVRAFPVVMSEFMAESRSVHLEGFGWFRYTAQASGKGVKTKEEVNSGQITGIRVQFTAERQRNMGSGTYTRALIGNNISFSEWLGKQPNSKGEVDDDTTQGGGSTGGGGGDDIENPLG